MTNKILIKRGLSSNLSSLILQSGEPAFAFDTGKLYIGNGTQNVLINPYDTIYGLNTVEFFSKMKVNSYGQVISQTNLTANDIPLLPTNKISGLGTAATSDTGTSSGNVPVINSNGKLSDSIIPSNTGVGFVSYNGSDITIPSGSYVPMNNYYGSNPSYISLDASGFLNINIAGLYLIIYTITSNTSTMSVTLGAGGINHWSGTVTKASTGTLTNPFVSTTCSLAKQVSLLPEKFGIRNIGTNNLVISSNACSISVVRIAS